jgi:beta-mannosidase
MNTVGIWLPVTLTFYDEAKLDYLWVRLDKLSEAAAWLDIVIALDGVEAEQNLTNKGLTAKLVRLDNREVQEYSLSAKFSNAKFRIPEPKLWWPNGLGQPHVYEFEVSLLRGEQLLDTKKVVYGIRTSQLDHEGTNFKVLINGHPVYCKGSNYVPPDMMYPRLINPDFPAHNTIANLLDDAVASNFNMLRLWGGGQYESEEFFELASKKGIMIFHDFMFSDSIYPGTDEFETSVRKEVAYQVRRVRNYPALVLWSGNNEILQGIESWGWGTPKYRENYKRIFGQLIPSILEMETSSIPYIESSPSRGVGNTGFGKGGDIHYWGVWAANAPFEAYETSIGGFNSEFGTQSLPVWETILKFTLPTDRSYESDKMLFHEKHGSKFRSLQLYMNRYAKKSVNFEMEAYNSGLVHAFAMEIAIRAQRIAKPRSWGTLYWMFNDAWPAVSWASIDYYGRWKAVQYHVKRYFQDVVLFFHPHSSKLVAVNDKLTPIKANYRFQLMTFAGKVLY